MYDRDVEGGLNLERSVERIGERLAISLPMSEGGNQFVDCTREIAEIDRDRERLNIFVPDWLAQKMHLAEGSKVIISNLDQKFTIWLA